MMRKVRYILFTLILLFSFFMIPIKTDAKTISDMQKELDKKQSEYDSKKQQQSNLNSNIKISKNQISDNQTAINKAEQDLIATGKKIQDLDTDIAKKNEEIKELMKLIQLTDADNGYLEYIFNAEDLTDFIHRLTMVEELAKYNEIKINEMNKMIEESKQLQIELKNKQTALTNQISELNNKINKYNSDLNSISELIVDVSGEIKTLRESIAYYKSKGCKENQDLNVCLRNELPYDTAFWRPIISGYVTSEFGVRFSPINGQYKIHYASDISSGNKSSETKLYAAAGGKIAVINAKNNNSCGGNYVIIHHNVKGTEYSTGYFHMQKVYVKLGQIVTKDTVIGIMGGNKYYSSQPGYTPWDGCSTGLHTHFMMSKGLDLSLSQLENGAFNPRTLVNFPGGTYNSFSNRTTKY